MEFIINSEGRFTISGKKWHTVDLSSSGDIRQLTVMETHDIPNVEILYDDEEILNKMLLVISKINVHIQNLKIVDLKNRATTTYYYGVDIDSKGNISYFLRLIRYMFSDIDSYQFQHIVQGMDIRYLAFMYHNFTEDFVRTLFVNSRSYHEANPTQTAKLILKRLGFRFICMDRKVTPKWITLDNDDEVLTFDNDEEMFKYCSDVEILANPSNLDIYYKHVMRKMPKKANQ
jgi:hypothetical protein